MELLLEPSTTVSAWAEISDRSVILHPCGAGSRFAVSLMLRNPDERRLWHYREADVEDAASESGQARLWLCAGGEWTGPKNPCTGGFEFRLNLIGPAVEAVIGIVEIGQHCGHLLMAPDSTEQEVRLTADAYCLICGGNLGPSGELHFGVCGNCAAKCQHSYPEADPVHLRYCSKCGRPDPYW